MMAKTSSCSLGPTLSLFNTSLRCPATTSKSPAVMPRPWCASLAGRLITLHGPPVTLNNRFLFFLLELCPSIITHPDKELVDALISKETVRELVYDDRYSVIAAEAFIKRFCVDCVRSPTRKRRKHDQRRGQNGESAQASMRIVNHRRSSYAEMSAVLAEFGFELNGRLVSDRGVEASPIVDLVDEDADVAWHLLDWLVGLAIDLFGLERLH